MMKSGKNSAKGFNKKNRFFSRTPSDAKRAARADTMWLEPLESRQLLSVGVNGQLPKVIQLTGLQMAMLAKAYPSMGLTIPAYTSGASGSGVSPSASAPSNDLLLGASSVFAADQPRVAVMVSADPLGLQPLGPNDYNTFLLDTAATSVLAGKDATAELMLNGADFPYTYNEAGVGGSEPFLLSGGSGYSIFYNGISIGDILGGGLGGPGPVFDLQQIDNVHMLAAPKKDLGFDGLIGMPAMVGRVLDLDMSTWVTNGLDFMTVNFPASVPSTIPSSQRFEVPLFMHSFDPEAGRVDPTAPPPTFGPLPFAPVRYENAGHIIDTQVPIDTGAQLSIISTQLAIDLGLDTNHNGSLDEEAEDFLDLAGVGGTVSVPLVSFDSVALRGKDVNGTDTNLKLNHMFAAVVDIDPTIPGIFGCDLLTSGWFDYLFGLAPQEGFFQQTFFDFKNVTQTTNDTTVASGKLVLNVTPDRKAPDPTPTIAGLSATAAANPGDPITLTATGVDFHGSTPTEVDFYLDVNDDGILQPNLDVIVAQVTDVTSTTISATVATEVTDPPGKYHFLVRAANSAGYASNVAGADTTIGPVGLLSIGSFTAAPSPANLGDKVTLTASNFTLSSGNTPAKVEFYDDVDSDGLINAAVDKLLGVVNSPNASDALTISTSTWSLGTHHLLAQLTDSASNTSDAAATSLKINGLPVLGSLSAPVGVASTGSFLLTAGNVSDPDGTVAQVAFYQDNGNGKFVAGEDALIGTDSDGTDGWTFSVTLNNQTPGVLRYFARAQDDTGAWSNAASRTTNVTQPPTVGSLTPSTTLISKGKTLSLTANGVADADGSVNTVEFYRDNGDGLFNPASDVRLGSDRDGSNGWTLDVVTSNWLVGSYTLFARAQDNMGLLGPATATTTPVTIDPPPTISSFTSSVRAMKLGDGLTLKATASSDTTAVDFFLDDGDGLFTNNDLLNTLGSATQNPDGSWSSAIAPGVLPVGTQKIWARAFDGLGYGPVRLLSVAVTTPPHIDGSFTASPNPVSRGQNLTLSVTNVIDDDGSVASVSFYRDADGDGLITAADKLLGIDVNGADGWGMTTSSASWTLLAGENHLLAAARDNLGISGAAVKTTVTIDPPPTISSFTSSVRAMKLGDGLTLKATASSDATAVDSFLDDGDGLFGAGDLANSLGAATLNPDGSWSTTIAPGVLPAGILKIWTRAFDGLGYGPVRLLSVTVTTPPHIDGSFTATPNPVSRGQNLTLTATNVVDDDGSVLNVTFYRDVDGDGLATAADKKLGTDVDGSDGWSITLPSAYSSLIVGENRLLAVPRDNLGIIGAARLTLVNIDAPPTISSFTSSSYVPKLSQSLTLTVKSSADTTLVEFFKDDGDGLFGAGDLANSLGTASLNAAGAWTLTLPATQIASAPATVKLWARAYDGVGYGIVKLITLNVVAG